MDTRMNFWKSGHITKIWDDAFKNFRYVRQPVTQTEIIEWRNMGYTHDTFTGELYDNKNPMPEWTSLLRDAIVSDSRIQLNDFTFTFYRMSTLEIMPPHIDHFRTYCKVFNVDRSKVYRALVMLEDWKPGHYLEVDKKGVVNWAAGDYFLWQADVEHAASNIGVEPRYSLQITCHE